MTWGITVKQDCMKCVNSDQCMVRREFWNLAPILTSVDNMPDGTVAPGQLEADCKGFKPKK
ncbi:MAG: hypothetical protein A4E53_01470 [Pelotomaculum sp. PtaB.Bin104]|nr:MAG: hypothetical protein A4E53_01470 [Pelotomaculum sp. PtaB.Bin104]